MIRRSYKDLIRQLENEGIRFTTFAFTSEGRFEITDADWNYKDVPHLHHLHQLVEAIPSNIGDDMITTINLQKVLGFRLPMSVVNYAPDPRSQTYYATMLFFVLLIETRYFEVDASHTRVQTTYSVGSTKLWKFLHPLIKWLLKRNYDDLMSEDIPMRTRRGDLRAQGYTFAGDNSQYSFEKTMHIAEPNVIAPQGLRLAQPLKVALTEAFAVGDSATVGGDNHLGFRLQRQGGKLLVFPRMCPHEGASLDKQACENGKLKCPWHGRSFTPLVTFDLKGQSRQQSQSGSFRFALEGDRLEIEQA